MNIPSTSPPHLNNIQIEQTEQKEQTVDQPKPRFMPGDLFTKTPLSSTSQHVQAYHIYGSPYWNSEHHCWSYPYDYGFGLTSEGYAVETSMYKVAKEDSDRVFL